MAACGSVRWPSSWVWRPRRCATTSGSDFCPRPPRNGGRYRVRRGGWGASSVARRAPPARSASPRRRQARDDVRRRPVRRGLRRAPGRDPGRALQGPDTGSASFATLTNAWRSWSASSRQDIDHANSSASSQERRMSDVQLSMRPVLWLLGLSLRLPMRRPSKELRPRRRCARRV